MVDFFFTNTVDIGDGYDNLLTVGATATVTGVNAAPAAVRFEVSSLSGQAAAGPSGTYDARQHDLIYLWSFDDAVNSTPRTDLNIPNRWQDMNVGRGFHAYHVYDDPGTYTVTLSAYEPATRRFGSTTVQVVIADPATVFPTNQTIVFDPNSTADVSGLTSPDVQTTWAGVISARDARGANDCRILMAPDADLTITSSNRIAPITWSNIRIGALDPDNVSRPVIRTSGMQGIGISDSAILDRNSAICTETNLYGLDLIGEWDSTNETGRSLRFLVVDKVVYSEATPHLGMLHKCEASGFEVVSSGATQLATSSHHQVISDTLITDWQNYGVIGSVDTVTDGHIAVIGSALVQNVNALSGGPKTGRMQNNHNPIRDFGADSVYFSCSDFFSRNGWSASHQFGGETKQADQPALRMNINGKEGSAQQVERCVIEGNIAFAKLSGATSTPVNGVFDNVIQLLGPMEHTNILNSIQYGGTTWKDFLLIKLDVPNAKDGGGGPSGWFNFQNLNDNADSRAAGWRIEHMTTLDMQSVANSGSTPVFTTSTNYDRTVDEDNLFHNPERDAQDGSNTVALGSILDGVTPRHKGPRYGFQPYSGTFSGDVTDGNSFTISYAVIGDAEINYDSNVGSATNQAYWTANQGTDTAHKIYLTGTGDHLFAEDSEFSVSFDASVITITNNTGSTWTNGSGYVIWLDRTTRLPSFNAQYDASALNLNVTVNATDTDTDTTPSTTNESAYDDILGAERPAGGGRKGASL